MTVEQWMRRYYKPNRFENEPGFNCDREQRLISSNEQSLAEDGYCLISHHDSVTGRCEAMGQPPAWYRGDISKEWHWTN